MSDLDLDALHAWMTAQGVPLAPPLRATKFAVGQSNPTYLIAGADRAVVLRMKPPGVLLKSAHAIDREFRVQRALAGTDVPVPQMHAYCDDASILGSAFYVMSHVAGRGFDDPRLLEIEMPDRMRYVSAMARTLAAIHNVDLRAVGLTDYGPHQAYFRRQIDRWSAQYAATQTEPIPEMDRLIAELGARCPDDDGRATLVHGDYRLDNLLFAPDAPQIVAVLDWELSTIGHPYADLAGVIMQWQMPPGEQGRGLRGVDRVEAGLMSDDAFVDAYCRLRGIDAIEDFGFYVAFCFFRMAAILQGVKKRALDGNASNPERGLALGAFVPDYARAGVAWL